MKRKEQIEKAAQEYINSDAVSPMNMQMAFGDFINGAKWADGHPTTTLLQPIYEHIKEVVKHLNNLYEMELEIDACNELHSAIYHLDETIENVELLINEED